MGRQLIRPKKKLRCLIPCTIHCTSKTPLRCFCMQSLVVPLGLLGLLGRLDNLGGIVFIIIILFERGSFFTSTFLRFLLLIAARLSGWIALVAATAHLGSNSTDQETNNE